MQKGVIRDLLVDCVLKQAKILMWTFFSGKAADADIFCLKTVWYFMSDLQIILLFVPIKFCFCE